MFCPECREERLTRAIVCAVCGGSLLARPREELERDLAHIRYVLEDSARWGEFRLARQAKDFLLPRYEARERVLLRALEGRFETFDEVEPAAPPPEEPILEAMPVELPPPDLAPVAPALPQPGPHEPLFDIPPSPPTPAQEAVEAVSTWRSVWRPFLYESIGWFIGAFLVIAGSIYFVALGWSGMSDVARALTLFALTAGYSAAFSTVGALLLRRDGLAGAGRVVALIGSAMAPFAPLAFASRGTEAQLLFGAMAALWALIAGWLVRFPARAYDPASVRWLMGGTALSVMLTALAPGLVSLFGAGSVWVGAVGVAVMAGAVRATRERSVEQAVFAALAPLYLGAVLSVRLHAAVAESGALVPLSTYAPFLAATLFLALRAWPRGDRLPAIAAVAVTAAQLTLIVTGGFGQAPAFFLTSAVALWTALWLWGHAAGGARWLYLAYVTGYLAYQSVGQLVPGWLQELLVRVRMVLGYPPGATLPFNYAAVYAIPFVIAGALLAVKWLRSSERKELHQAAGEVLLRATAGALLFFAVEGLVGRDLRPAVWAAAPLGLSGLALGVWLNRAFLSWAGWTALLIFVAASSVVFGPASGAILGAGLALALTVAAWRTPAAHALTHGGLLQTVLSALLGCAVLLEGDVPVPVVIAAGFASLAAWAGWWKVRHPAVELWALALTCAVPPLLVAALHPSLAPLALALSAVGVALLPTRFAAPMATVASLVAAAWQGFFDAESLPFGVVLASGVVANALAARRYPWLGVIAALFWTVLLLPSSDVPADGGSWPWLSPLLSSSAYAATALAASVHAFFRGRSTVNIAVALFAALTSVLTAGVFSVFGADDGPLLLLAAAAVALASRALRAEVCIPAAALLVLSHVGWDGHEGRLLLALGLTALSLTGAVRGAAERWLGAVRAPQVAAFAAAFTIALGLVTQPQGPMALAFVAAATVLPVVWFGATGSPVFLTLAGMLAVTAGVRIAPAAAFAPLLAVAVTSQWVVRREDEDADRRARFPAWVLAGFISAVALWTAGVVLGATAHTDGTVPLAIAVAALSSAGLSLSSRFLVVALAVLLVPQLRGVTAVAMACAGVASIHAARALAFLLRPAAERYAAPAAGAVSVLLAVAALLDVPRWAGWSFAPALALLAATALFAERRLLTASIMAAGAALVFGQDALALEQPSLLLIGGAAAIAAIAAAWRSLGDRRQEALLVRLAPGLNPRLDAPLWFGAAALVAGWLGLQLLGNPARGLESVLALVTVFLLWRVEGRVELGLQVALWSAVAWVALPTGVGGLTVAISGLAVVLLSTQRHGEHPLARELLHAGWVLALVGLVGSGGLREPMFPLTVLASLGASWLAAARTPAREWLGWMAAVVAAHLWIFHLGLVFSSGRGAEFILPFTAVGSALVAVVAGVLPRSPSRRGALLGAGVLACAELTFALLAIPGAGGREAIAAVAAMALLGGVLVYVARRQDDEAAAFLAQVALLLGYLGARVLGSGAVHGADGLVALVTGAVFCGLHVWARRDAQSRRAFVRPALFSAYVFPLVGLLAAPWDEPHIAAALLVGHAAHFAVLSGVGSRRLGAIASALAFNAALVFVWEGTHAGEAEYYVIPFGLSLLALGHVFRHELPEVWHARLRAVAITTIYSASAWRALLFTDPLSLGVCALACVLGVAAGIALRIRSFVYLGTGFLVTTVVANLVRTGLREPHLGALFLSILGVLVVGFMVLFTAQRAELLRRYDRMKTLLADWEG